VDFVDDGAGGRAAAPAATQRPASPPPGSLKGSRWISTLQIGDSWSFGLAVTVGFRVARRSPAALSRLTRNPCARCACTWAHRHPTAGRWRWPTHQLQAAKKRKVAKAAAPLLHVSADCAEATHRRRGKTERYGREMRPALHVAAGDLGRAQGSTSYSVIILRTPPQVVVL